MSDTTNPGQLACCTSAIGPVCRHRTTPVADALQAVDNVQGSYARYVEALEDLADAVREHGIGQDLAAKRLPAVPVPDTTEHDGYTVRAVITTSGRNSAWWVAAQGGPGFGMRWSTWRAERTSDGRLWFSSPTYHDGPSADRNREDALAHLAERAGVAVAPPF